MHLTTQEQDGHEHVWSRRLDKAERRYSTIEREGLAAVCVLKEFYPSSHANCMVTDHNPLKGLKDVGRRLNRWMVFFQQFDLRMPFPDHHRRDWHPDAAITPDVQAQDPMLATVIELLSADQGSAI